MKLTVQYVRTSVLNLCYDDSKIQSLIDSCDKNGIEQTVLELPMSDARRVLAGLLMAKSKEVLVVWASASAERAKKSAADAAVYSAYAAYAADAAYAAAYAADAAAYAAYAADAAYAAADAAYAAADAADAAAYSADAAVYSAYAADAAYAAADAADAAVTRRADHAIAVNHALKLLELI